MKSTQKVWMVALLAALTVALLVAPAAARTGYDGIVSGDTIFIYEKGLNVTSFTGTVTRFVHYDDVTTFAVDDVIAVTDEGNFNVPSTVKFPGGVYYASGAALGNTEFVIIDMPEISIDVVNGDTLVDKLNDRIITKGTPITFRITSNVPAGFNDANFIPYVELRFTTPDGGQTRIFGVNATGADINYARVNLTGVDFYVSNVPGFDPSDTTTVTSGLWQVNARWPANNALTPDANEFFDFYGEGLDSAVRSFTISAGQVTLTTNKDQVIRNAGFSLQISGRGNQNFILYIRDASLTCNEYPWMIAAQPGVTQIGNLDNIDGVTNEIQMDCAGATNADSTFIFKANVLTTAAGSRTVQFDTNELTKDRTYTFDVYQRQNVAGFVVDTQISDSVTVKVVKGAITIDVGGEATFYMGQEVTFTGENTDSEEVFLFITGPNLCSCGASIEDPSSELAGSAACNTAPTSTLVTVEGDDSWEYKWNTAEVGLDAGTYTIYAATTDESKCTLADKIYDQVSVTLRKPFINASLSASRVAKGDELLVQGTAEGNPDSIFIWIFGTNFVVQGVSEAVEDDNTFEYKIDRGTTEDLTSGQYFVVVQHPMYNGEQDVFSDGTNVRNRISGVAEFSIAGPNRLMGSDAAQALVDALDSANVDDTYTRLFFLVEEPFINIQSIPDQTVGATFTMSGTTNLAVDDTLLITVTSSSFSPTQKTTGGEFSGVSGTTTVVKGTGVDNTWSFDVDTTGFKPDQYIVTVECVETTTTATTTFFVSEVPPTTVTTQPTVTTTTTTTTTVPPTTTTVPPTTTPGFGAVIALIGLGAVAVLVLRRH
jgi:Predicted solute binding protein